MKRIKLNYLLLQIMALSAISAEAYDFVVDGIYYNKSGINATVTYQSYSNGTYTSDYTGSVTIPKTVTYNGTTYSVTSIGYDAFYGCSGLTSVTIPNSVTSIGYDAFYGCSGLTSVTIPNSVTSIGSEAFRNCSGLTSVTIGNSVTSIGYFAFYGCSGLTSVTIPNSVTSIDLGVFSGCRGLTSVTIPNSVTSIGSEAFWNCSGLTSVIIPNSVTSIGNYAFYGCNSLTSITIPNTVTSIGDYAFLYCSGLTSITIPNSVTSIGIAAFNASIIKTVIWDAVNCTSIGENTFSTSVTALQFGNEVKHIPAGMPSLSMSGKVLVLPNSVKTIDAGAFSGSCSTVVIGDQIETIATGAFPTGISVAYVTAANPRPCSTGAFANPQTLYVPAGSKMKYFISEGWGEFANIVEGDYVRATAISFGQPSALIAKGSTQQLTATILPSNATATTVNWLSLNPDVATVNSSGQITGITVGETDIVAFVDNVRDTCHVTVTPVKAQSLTLSNSQLTLEPDDMFTLTATVLPANTENPTLEWIIPDNDVIVTQVANNTRLNIGAVNTGSVTITVHTTDGSNLSASCTVTVRVAATSIALNMTSAEMTEDGVLQLIATVLPTNATNRTVTWTSSNTSVATVNSSGVVTAVAPGTATITATTNDDTNLSASCLVTVNSRVLATSITLNESIAELTEGNSMQLTATVLPDNATNKSVIWSTSNSSVATVNGDGLVTAIAPGIAQIVATTTDGSNLATSCTLTVKPINNSLELPELLTTPGSEVTIPVYLHNDVTVQGLQLTLFYPDEFEFVSVTKGERFSNSTQLSSTLRSKSCRVMAVDLSGYPIIDDAGDGVILYFNLKVPSSAIGTYSISLENREDFSLMINDLSNIYYLDDTYGTITVQSIPVTAIELNKTSATIVEGETLQLNATVQPDNATNKNVSWSTSDSNVATVDNNGLVTAVVSGTATITATTTDGSELSSSCVVTVQPNIVLATSIDLNPTATEVTEGETLQLVATVLPDNTTNKSVAWTSSNPAIATVDEDGLVTAVAPGSATITATTVDGSNLSASCLVTVIGNQVNYDNYLSMSDTTVMHGETIVIPVKMTNDASIISFQTDIFFPEGFELLQEDGEYIIDPSSRMTRTHSIMSNAVSNGAIRVVCYSSNNKSFTGESGDDLFYLTVKVADDAEGDYTIQLKNTLFTTSDFDELSAPTATANVNVKAYLLGDANNSGTVTVTDVVVTSQYVLEMDPNPFIFDAADVNFDDNITVTDVSRIAWMVLNPTLNAPQLLRAPALWNNGDLMRADGITLAAGETRRVSILLDNDMDYVAFQLDLELPAGLTAGNFQLTDRASSHAFDVNVLRGGKIRALCYTPALTAISGHEGALLTFDVTATGTVKGDITVDGIELVTTTCQTVNLDGFAIGVNNSSSVNELSTGKAITRVDYFNLAGQQVDRPDSGVTLVVTTYTDGTRTTTKIIQ